MQFRNLRKVLVVRQPSFYRLGRSLEGDCGVAHARRGKRPDCAVRLALTLHHLGQHRKSKAVGLLVACAAAGAVAPAFAHSMDKADSSWAVALQWLIVIAMGAAFLFYAAGLHRLWRNAHTGAGVSVRQAAYYFSGWVVLAAALLSPIDTLGEELFSMHMVQHELMMLGAAPLLILGKPLAVFIWSFPASARKGIGGFVRRRAIQTMWSALNQPFFAWLLHLLVLWAWHFPSLFQASLADDGVHALQHFSFLASALLFWAALIGPQGGLRNMGGHYGGSVLYVLTTTIHTGVLGALLTFSPHAWYPVYEGRTEHWGLTLLEDQQLGGLIMWVPAGVILVVTGMLFAARAITPPERNDHAKTRPGQLL
jgi:putative membrane protein